jgi:hypothetical protein
MIFEALEKLATRHFGFWTLKIADGRRVFENQALKRFESAFSAFVCVPI